MIARQVPKNTESSHNTTFRGCGNEEDSNEYDWLKDAARKGEKAEEREPDLDTITDASDIKIIKLKSLLKPRDEDKHMQKQLCHNMHIKNLR